MRFGAGEIDEGRAEARVRHDPCVHLQAGLQPHRRPRRTLRDDLGDFIVGGQRGHDRRRATARDDEVEVAHGVARAAITAGDHHLPHARDGGEVRPQGFGVARGVREFHASRRSALAGDRVQDTLLRARPEARQLPHTPVVRRARELLDGLYAEHFVQLANAHRAKARELQQLGHARRRGPLQLIKQRAAPGRDDLADPGREIRADPG